MEDGVETGAGVEGSGLIGVEMSRGVQEVS